MGGHRITFPFSNSFLSSTSCAPKHFHGYALSILCTGLWPSAVEETEKGQHHWAHTRCHARAPPGGGEAGPRPCRTRALEQARDSGSSAGRRSTARNFPPRPGKADVTRDSAPSRPPGSPAGAPAPEYLPPVPPLRCAGSVSS